MSRFESDTTANAFLLALFNALSQLLLMEALLSRLKAYPCTRQLVSAVLELMPDHATYLEKSFRDRSAATIQLTEQSAELISRIEHGAVERLAQGYRWLCGMIQEEELYFRREGKYRNTSFAEVDAAVYQNHAGMSQYMDGLLASEVLWIQHARAMDFYVNTFLAKLPPYARHLEVGPGHGLLFDYAARHPHCASLTGWDISPASLQQTAACMEMMKVKLPLTLETQDIMKPPAVDQPWDSIVISEVLEHLEDPLTALKNLRRCISDHGILYVNVPVNAPTIDHIHLFSTPEEAVTLVEKAGFIVDELLLAPGAGHTLTKARKISASITVALAVRPAC